MTKKGIVDPWRVVAPLRPEKEVPSTKRKIDPSEIDMDAELRATQHYVLQSPYGSIRIDSKDIASESDALRLLVACFLHLVVTPKYRDLFKEAGIGFQTDKRQWNVPSSPRAIVRAEESALYFAKHTHEKGMLSLIGVLNQINRVDRGLLNKYGVSTLLR